MLALLFRPLVSELPAADEHLGGAAVHAAGAGPHRHPDRAGVHGVHGRVRCSRCRPGGGGSVRRAAGADDRGCHLGRRYAADGHRAGRPYATAAAAFVSLLVLRFVLGVGEAAMFPVAGRVVADWVPAPARAFSNAVVILRGDGGISVHAAARRQRDVALRLARHVYLDGAPADRRGGAVVVAVPRPPAGGSGPQACLAGAGDQPQRRVDLRQLLPRQLRPLHLRLLALQVPRRRPEVHDRVRRMGGERSLHRGGGGIAVGGISERSPGEAARGARRTPAGGNELPGDVGVDALRRRDRRRCARRAGGDCDQCRRALQHGRPVLVERHCARRSARAGAAGAS